MKTFTFCLNIQVDARDSEEALDIAKTCAAAITDPSSSFIQPYKVQVDIDDVEEA